MCAFDLFIVVEAYENIFWGNNFYLFLFFNEILFDRIKKKFHEKDYLTSMNRYFHASIY